LKPFARLESGWLYTIVSDAVKDPYGIRYLM
jgi:hypothetical protein